MSEYLDTLIENAVVVAEIEAGANPDWLVRQGHDARVVRMHSNMDAARPQTTQQHWTEQEKDFLRSNHGWLSIDEIADALGRTPVAVKLYAKRNMALPAITIEHPEWLTARAAQRALGMSCGKQVVRLIEMGILPARKLPTERIVWAVDRQALLRFAVNPMNWIYFDPANVQNSRIKRLVELRRVRWGDEWWSTGQAAAYHGVCISMIQKRIKEGYFPSARRRANWLLLRSDVTRPEVVFHKGKGGVQAARWNGAADAFLVLATAIGVRQAQVDRLAGKTCWAHHRLKLLRGQAKIEAVIQKHGLAVAHDQDRLFADWRAYAERFPALSRAMERFLDQGILVHRDFDSVVGVVRTWLAWHGSQEQRKIAAQMKYWTWNHRGNLLGWQDWMLEVTGR